jgi:hypothetical protein
MRVALIALFSVIAVSTTAQDRSCIPGRDGPLTLAGETIRLGAKREAFIRFVRESVQELVPPKKRETPI